MSWADKQLKKHKMRKMVEDALKDKVFTVVSEPWNLCGTVVVKLEGISGGYALDGLEEVAYER